MLKVFYSPETSNGFDVRRLQYQLSLFNDMGDRYEHLEEADIVSMTTTDGKAVQVLATTLMNSPKNLLDVGGEWKMSDAYNAENVLKVKDARSQYKAKVQALIDNMAA